jgi:carbon-monoxide dehydrogenase large subunit
MTVLGAAKVPFFNRDTLAAMLNLSPGDVDLIEKDVGGGFGVRGEFYPEDFLIPFAARHVGRPVRWIEDRREHLTAMNHARQADCEVEIACRRDGTILGLRGEVFVDLGAYVRTNGLIARSTVLGGSAVFEGANALLAKCSAGREAGCFRVNVSEKFPVLSGYATF